VLVIDEGGLRPLDIERVDHAVLEELVGGPLRIQRVTAVEGGRTVQVVTNRDAKLLGLAPRAIAYWNGSPYDVLAGTIVFVAAEQDGSPRPLGAAERRLVEERVRRVPRPLDLSERYRVEMGDGGR